MIPPCPSAKRPFPAAPILALLALVLPVFAGCARSPLTSLEFDAEGKPVELRREAKRHSVDFLHRFRAKAYDKTTWWDVHMISDDQEAVLSENGRPDFVRVFRSTDRERIVEWMYAEKNLLVQFRKGRQVFDGPVTDLERILLRRGYPRFYMVSRSEKGPKRQTLIYRYPLTTRIDTYSFSDGRLVSMDE
ncbi:hypothetical protein JW916_00400 [Candidatus Sumerlaeota bacterium]|nr:hypothetical protein [Candidatus Sumerlaeota bacterium]